MAYTFSFDHFVPYRELNGTDRPIVVAELRVNGATEYFPMLLDCGADNIVLPAYLLATFGLAAAGAKEENARSVWGIQTGYTVPDVGLKFPDYDQDWSVSIPMRSRPTWILLAWDYSVVRSCSRG